MERTTIMQKTIDDYKKLYDELQIRKANKEPSISYWRLNAKVQNMEKKLLELLREGKI